MAFIYLIRHGETEHNANHIIQGQIDSPLTELGQKQVEETAEELKNIKFSTCYYSPLGRTTKTTQTILKYHEVEAVAKAELMEINMGILEGMINDHTLHGTEFKNFAVFPHMYTTPVKNGETYDALTGRVYNCCQEIVDKHLPEDKILIVSHGGPIRSLLNPLVKKTRSQFWLAPDITPASISIVKWDKNSEPELISFAGVDRDSISFNNAPPTSIIRPN